MATIFEVTAALSGLALFCLMALGFRRLGTKMLALERSVREGMGVLAGSVGAETAAQRRELAAVAQARAAEPAAAASTPTSTKAPGARPVLRRLAQRIDAGQEAARQRLAQPLPAPPSSSTPEITITGDASEDEHKTLEVVAAAPMTARPPAPIEDEEEPEELTTVAAPPKASASTSTKVLKTAPPAVLKHTGYRLVKRDAAPAIDVLKDPAKAVADLDDAGAASRVQELAHSAGVRIGEDEKTPPSGTPIEVGRVQIEEREIERRRAGAFLPYRPEASYPAIEVPAPHRSARS